MTKKPNYIVVTVLLVNEENYNGIANNMTRFFLFLFLLMLI